MNFFIAPSVPCGSLMSLTALSTKINPRQARPMNVRKISHIHFMAMPPGLDGEFGGDTDHLPYGSQFYVSPDVPERCSGRRLSLLVKPAVARDCQNRPAVAV